MENKGIFRQKSIERVSSPEELNNYLRVCSPSVWLTIVAVILLLVGVCVWGVFGHLDTTVTTVGVAHEGTLTVYVTEDEATAALGKTASVEGGEYTISAYAQEPVSVTEANFSEYERHVGGLQIGEWVFSADFATQLPDGVYEAQIITDSISPMSFVLN